MKKLIVLAFLSVSTLLSSNIEIKDAYVRATPPGLVNSAAFMKVENNTSENISIVKATSNLAKNVELHTHDMKDGVMRMYQVPKIDIPKNGQVELKPGGFHVMLIGLNNPLKKGKIATLSLEFSNGETKTIQAPIKSVMGGMNHKQMSHDMNHKN